MSARLGYFSFDFWLERQGKARTRPPTINNISFAACDWEKCGHDAEANDYDNDTLMTPCKKELVELVSLALQARRTLGALYKTVHRVKREMESTSACCDKLN